MKKSKKVLTFSAVIAGLGIAGALANVSMQNNPSVYGPPPEDVTIDMNQTTESSDDTEQTTAAMEEFEPDDNMNVDVYGPPPDDLEE